MIKIGVVGCGYWGPNLIRNFAQLENTKLHTCCDLEEGKLNKIKQQYPYIKTTKDYNDLLNDEEIDAVVIATPASAHYKIAKDCLFYDKHVLVEKPLSTDSLQADELVRLANKKDRILMVGHTFLYNSAVVKIKEYIEQGDIGDIYYIYSARVSLGQIRKDVNALWNLAPHDISILLYLLNTLPVQVSARGKSYLQKGVEDVVFLTLYFPNDIISEIHVSWLDPSKVRKMTIVGSKKMINYDDIDNEAKIKVYDKGVFTYQPDKIFGEFQLKLRTGDIFIPKIDLSEPLRNECLHFLECIKDKKRPLTDGESGVKVIKVLEAAQKSLNNNGHLVEVK